MDTALQGSTQHRVAKGLLFRSGTLRFLTWRGREGENNNRPSGTSYSNNDNASAARYGRSIRKEGREGRECGGAAGAAMTDSMTNAHFLAPTQRGDAAAGKEEEEEEEGARWMDGGMAFLSLSGTQK